MFSDKNFVNKGKSEKVVILKNRKDMNSDIKKLIIYPT